MADGDWLSGAGSGAVADGTAGSVFGPVGTLLGAGIGAGIGAYGAWQSGQANKAANDYKAAVARANAQIAQQNADYARAAGEVEAQQAGMKVRYQIGQTKAIQGASGLDVSSGSAAAVRTSEKEIGDENVAIIRNNAAKQAYGFEVQAMNFNAQGTLDTMAGAQAQEAGYIGAASSIVGGASSVSSKWTAYKMSGAL